MLSHMIFFFSSRRRHTRFDCDWSSDVCSSDLINVLPLNVSTDPAQLNRIRTQYQNFRPYPQFGSIQHYSNYGHDTYHGMTLRVEKRYSKGMTINSFWTWSKTMDESDNDGGASGVTWYNRKLEKGRAGFDISHRWVSTVTYELPDRKSVV